MGFLLCALVLMGCAEGAGGGTSSADSSGVRSSAVALGERFSLDTGRTVTVGDGGLRVTYAELVEDSRCPPEQTCVWEGDAVVRLVLDMAGDKPREVTLHTYDQQPGAANYGPYRIELIAVSRASPQATLVVTR